MHRHKFRVGQMVRFEAATAEQHSPGSFKILRLVTGETGECAYCIKTIMEATQRIAEEHQITEIV